MPQPRAPRLKNKQTPQALEKIRPELNLEKWSIWHPAKSKNQPKTRIIERQITLPNGNKINAKLEVGYTDRGELTTEDQKTYYALVKHWEDHGRPEQYTPFSLRRIAKLLQKKWGTNVIDSVTQSLMRLRGTLLVWENSYYDNTTKETAELIDTFNILSELKIIRRKIDGVVNSEVGYFRFNDFTLKNLQTNHTKPVLFDVVLSFKSQTAQVLYTHVDLILAANTFYERRTKELFEDLGISGAEYRKPSVRKRLLQRALKELQNLPLSKSCFIASATLERTKDRKDYKVVFRKASAIATGTAAAHPMPVRETEDAPPSPSAHQLSPAEQQAEELLRYFHNLFFGVEPTSIRPHHRDLAASIIAQYGFEVAQHIVDFAFDAARKSNFQIATFGAVMQYIARAVADYEKLLKDHQRRQQHIAEEAAHEAAQRTELEARTRADERYSQLSEQERDALTQRYRAELIAREPTWAQPNAQGDRPLLNAAVKAAIIKHLMREQSRGQGEETGEEMISSASA